MEPNHRHKACELGYDVIQADPSHAEGQFLQFLYKRMSQNPGLYTHIVGMGCSRRHCCECDSALKLCLGKNYSYVTAAAQQQQVGSSPSEEGFAINIICKVLYKDEAADSLGRPFQHFHTPPGLHRLIEKKLDTEVEIYKDGQSKTRQVRKKQ